MSGFHHTLVSPSPPFSDCRAPELLAKLFADEAAGLERFLARRVADPFLAEELVAETFARACRSWSRYDRRRASPKTWLYAIGLNCVNAHSRRVVLERRALERLAAGDATQGDMEETVQRRVDVVRLLAGLNAAERDALLLRYAADLPMRDVARRTGTSLTTADGRVRRGLRKLHAASGAAVSGNGSDAAAARNGAAACEKRKPRRDGRVDRA